jgi:hypothetical protein
MRQIDERLARHQAALLANRVTIVSGDAGVGRLSLDRTGQG